MRNPMVLTEMNLQNILLELGPEIEKHGLVYDAEIPLQKKILAC
jgi:hypothetical protein